MISLRASKKQSTEDSDHVSMELDDKEAHGFKNTPAEDPHARTVNIIDAFALDLRSLALFRVAIAFMVLVDLMLRAVNIFPHYANLGVWPVVEAIANLSPHSYSLHFTNGSTSFQAILFLISGLFSLSMLVGYKTKLSNIFLWILIVSLHNRNILLLNTGDDLLRILLFWSIFLPTNARYSVDSITNPDPTFDTNRFVGFSSFALIIQFVCMYWVGYVLKTGIEWEEGTALYYAFSIDQYTTPFGYFILRFPRLLSLLTHVYLWMELLIPFLICFPLMNGPVRTVAVVISILMHLGLGSCLELGMFTWAPVLGSLALLPTWFWDHLLRIIGNLTGLKHRPRTILVYHDPDNLWTQFALKLAHTFLGLTLSIRPAQDSEEGVLEDMRVHGHQWVVIDTTGRKLYRHRAALALLGEAPLVGMLATALVKAEPVVSAVYRWVSTLLEVFFSLSTPPHTPPSSSRTVPSPHQKLKHHRSLRQRHPALSHVRPSDIVALISIAYVVWWNMGAVNNELSMPSSLQWIGPALRVDQWWSMFAPYPMKDDGWYVIPAKLNNGKEVDLWKHGEPVTFEKPQFVSRSFPDHRWRKYMMNLWSTAHQEKRLFYGRYLCRQWNWYGMGGTNKEYALRSFKIVYMREITLPNYKVKGPEPIVLWEHQC